MFLLGLLLYNFLFRATENNFKIYWGIPSGSCRTKFQIDFTSVNANHGLIQNANDSVRGDKIAILYDPGMWPSIELSRDGQLIYNNGGLPQNGSIDLHLRQLEVDIDRFIPNKTFDGLAVIDFECWRPTFRQNFGDLKVYRDLTLLEVNKKHPTWSRDQIESQGRIIFESAAINFVNRTIMRARKLRPFAKWGFYGFPHCFNRHRDYSQLERCSEAVEAENNKLLFMFPTAVFPSIYITQNQTGTALTKFVQGKMRESDRIGKMTANASILKLAFIRYQYTDSMGFMSSDDMMNVLKAVKSEGGNGVILWGSSSQFKTEPQCKAFKSYFETDFIRTVQDFRKIRKSF